MDVLLSFVIPVFNVEKYIDKCLSSILSQKEIRLQPILYEIILVDDGSIDNSGIICDKYAEEYPLLIKSIHQSNQGLSIARNNGMKIANGQYIWFIDSDDWIISDAISQLMPILSLGTYEAVAIESNKAFSSGKLMKHFAFSNGGSRESTGITQLLSNDMSCCVPLTIYSNSYLRINKLEFYEHIFHEDTEFSPRAYVNLKRLYLLDSVLYMVSQNQGSITRSRNFKKNFDILIVSQSLDRFYHNGIDDNKSVISRRIAQCINASLLSTSKMDKATYDAFFRKLKDSRYLFRHYFRFKSFKYFIEGIAICLNAKLYAKFYDNYFNC